MTKSLYDAFGTNAQYEKEGVWLDFGDGRIRVRRAGGSNRRYLTTFAAKTKPFRHAIQTGTLSTEKEQELLQEVYWESVIVDWEGIHDRQGNEMEFSRDNFKRLMSDLPELWAAIRNECESMRNFQDAENEADGEELGK